MKKKQTERESVRLWTGQHRFDSLTGSLLLDNCCWSPSAFPSSIQQQAWKQNERGKRGKNERKKEKRIKGKKEASQKAFPRSILRPVCCGRPRCPNPAQHGPSLSHCLKQPGGCAQGEFCQEMQPMQIFNHPYIAT